MTDEPALATTPEPDHSRDRARIEPSVTHKSADLLPGLYLLGFVALAGAMYFLWSNPPESRLAPQEANKVDTLQSEVNALRDQVAALRAKPAGPTDADIARLQQQVSDAASRPIPPPVSLQPVEARLAALEGRPTATPEQVQQLTTQVIQLAKQTPDLQPVRDRLDALDKRLGDLETQQRQTAGQVQQAAQTGKDQGARLDALDSGAKQVGGQVQQLENDGKAQGGRLEALESQTKQNADQVKAIAQKSQLATRLQSAAAALAAGTKLGDIPGAPPALARFASEAPPTEASLRGSFETYALKAQQASEPSAGSDENFASRIWSRAQGAVTVRQGDRVLVGDPAAGVIARARELLEQGDLADAAQALAGLSGASAQAMQPWVDKAKSLLDARTAIASMAAG